MHLDVRKFDGNEAVELHITAVPTPGLSAQDQGREIFSAVSKTLIENNGSILQERVFGTDKALTEVAPIRTDIYGDLDDGIKPAWLSVVPGIKGDISGIYVHAVAGAPVTPVQLNGTPCGRTVTSGNTKFLTVSAIPTDAAVNAEEQADQMLNKAEAILKHVGGDFLAVPRTWMWLGNILDWYDEFNTVRNEFFIERNMIGRGMVSKMPASTGISVGPVGQNACTMDFTAVVGSDQGMGYLDVGGNQHSAYDYGSAFSRGSWALSPAGKTVYVSGTASIDEEGNTTNLDNADAQIDETIENVIAVLKELDCTQEDLAFTYVYCKTPEIEKLFCKKYPDFAWPHITMVADVCRHDLLFEIEATAVTK